MTKNIVRHAFAWMPISVLFIASVATAGTISGRVYEEAAPNNAIAGVEVQFFQFDNAQIIATSSSDIDGTYSSGPLPDGTYRVRFSGAGMDPTYSGAKDDFCTSSTYLIDNKTDAFVDQALRTSGPSKILETSTSFKGTILDAATGKPIEGIGVEAYNAFSGILLPRGSAISDAAGRYEIGGARWPPVRLRFVDPANQYYPEYSGAGSGIDEFCSSTTFSPNFNYTIGALLTLIPKPGQKDPCTEGSNGAIDSARDYQKAARDVKSICADVTADCDSAEATADLALLNLTDAHQVMINACGLAGPPPPPPPAQSPTLFGDLVINEVMANPDVVSDVDGEWIELYNPTSTNFDMNGLTIRITAGTVQDFIINSTLVVPANGFVILGKTTDTSLNDGVSVDYTASFILPNNSFSLEISNGTTLLDSVSFGGFTPGASQQLDVGFVNATDNDDLTNWCPSQIPYGVLNVNKGSPGGSNVACTL